MLVTAHNSLSISKTWEWCREYGCTCLWILSNWICDNNTNYLSCFHSYWLSAYHCQPWVSYSTCNSKVLMPFSVCPVNTSAIKCQGLMESLSCQAGNRTEGPSRQNQALQWWSSGLCVGVGVSFHGPSDFVAFWTLAGPEGVGNALQNGCQAPPNNKGEAANVAMLLAC